jgi:OOP family OmpA-OmpF porin
MINTRRFDMTSLRIVWSLGLALALQPSWADEKARVLSGKKVTESALIEALTIEGPPAPADGLTRGFGIARPSKAPHREGSGAGKASLLMTFAVDSSELTGDTVRMLDTVAKALQSDQLAGFSFRIEGHADPRGGDQWNRQLSQKRAEAVVAYLVERHGILPERLAPLGKGASELLDKGNPNAAVNRRVTIVTTRG